jgi:hypothetical protein
MPGTDQETQSSMYGASSPPSYTIDAQQGGHSNTAVGLSPPAPVETLDPSALLYKLFCI